MPKYVAAETTYNYHVDFMVNGQPVIPTSASLTLTRNDGTIIAGLENTELELGSGDNYVDIELESEANEITLTNEIRYIDITFAYDGQTYYHSDYYFLKPSLKFPISNDEIRAILGLSASELPDEYIDKFSAIYLVQADVGEAPDIQAIVADGDARLPAVLEAVRLRAAMQFMTSIQSSTMQMEQADNTLYKRFMEIDFDAMRSDLSGRYALALQQIRGDEAIVTPVISILAQGTDAVTGQ